MSKLALPIAGAVAAGVAIALVIVFWDSSEPDRPALPTPQSSESASPASTASSASSTPEISGSENSSESGAQTQGNGDAAQTASTQADPNATASTSGESTGSSPTEAPSAPLPQVREVEVPPVSEARVPENPLRPKLETTEQNRRAGSLARSTIADIRSGKRPFNPEALHEQAESFRAEGQFVDAHLLDFFCAREGYGPSAFTLAKVYDPTVDSKESQAMGEPDAMQAHKWYTKAKAAGVAGVDERLAELHYWVKKAANDGDVELQVLLSQW